MENKNYDIFFQHEIEKIKNNPLFKTRKPTLLLHVCCAPCSSAVLERLADTFDITVYYYNPNIHPKEEYARRLNELTFFLQKNYEKRDSKKPKIFFQSSDYNPSDFFAAVQTDEFPERKTEQERGQRCLKCYELRIKNTGHFAREHNFDYFTTALSISPHKDSHMINIIGENTSKELTVNFLYADFKKRNGYKRSLELSKEFNLYRQDYCGCIYSKTNSNPNNKQL